MGRWTAEGLLEFRGRRDEQVKIRGQRVELGELEERLKEVKGVKEVVVVKGVKGNESYLAVFYTGEVKEREELEGHLGQYVPASVLPSRYRWLEEIPLTGNGKVDRRRMLLLLEEPEADGPQGYVGARNEQEREWVAIWEELLGREGIGIHDNFFELGGDSIITIQMVSRARRYGYSIKAAEVFANQTIAKLVRSIKEHRSPGAEKYGEQGLLTGRIGLLPIQQRYLWTDPMQINLFHQSLFLGIAKEITVSELETALQRLMDHHDALRCRFHKAGEEWVQEYGSGKVTLEVADWSDLAHYPKSLDVEKGVVVRMVLLRTPATESHHRLLLVVHHLVVDGVSWRILLEDLETLLTQLKEGKETELGKKGSSYRQWYEFLRKYGESRQLAGQRGYWEQVSGAYGALPVNKEVREAAPTGGRGVCRSRLEKNWTTELLQNIGWVYNTDIDDVLLAALTKTLCEWAGADRINIGMEGHGREELSPELDLSRTVGWFTTLYPVLLEWTGPGQMEKLLTTVKENRRMIPDKGIGFGVLNYFSGDRNVLRKDPWDIQFNYLGQTDNVINQSRWLKEVVEPAGHSDGVNGDGELEVNCIVETGELTVNWTFDSGRYDRQTIEKLADNYLRDLRSLIVHCKEQGGSGPRFTPSDYGIGGEVGIEELNDFLAAPVNGSTRRSMIEGLYRLSGLQEGILFHALYHKNTGAYIQQTSFEARGLDPELFVGSWAQLSRRHSILRTVFYYDVLSLPVQCVWRQLDLPVEIMDCREMTEPQQGLLIKKYETEDRRRGFDFGENSLMRLALFRIEQDKYKVIWTAHHLVLDGWSLPVVMREFLETYESLKAGLEPSREEDRYEDYIRYLERRNVEKEESYWKGYLGDVEGPCLLPFIAATAERNKGEGVYAEEVFQTDAAMTGRVGSYAQKSRITVNTVMQGVWAFLLHRYTGSARIVYGVTVSGRPAELPGVEQRVGIYINTLPLYSVMREAIAPAEWLQNIQREQQLSREFQYTPLGNIQKWTGVKGDLFDTILVFENYPVSAEDPDPAGHLEVDAVSMLGQNNYPLSIVIGADEKLTVHFRYNTGLLDGRYVRRMRDHFEQVLRQMIEGEADTLAGIQLVTPKEAAQLLGPMSVSHVNYPKDRTIVDLFAEQALRIPEAPAIVFQQQSLSYRELNERSDRLAQYLRRNGVGKETPVLVSVRRSMECITGILGILKAGGVYVPVDPSYPDDRIAYILEDTGSPICLSDRALRQRSDSFSKSVRFIDIKEEWAQIEEAFSERDERIDPPVPRQLMYVIYTSGSTGRPKGVMIEHRHLLDHIYGLIGSTELKACVSFALIASLVADAGHSILFSAFVLGGAVHILSEELLSDSEGVIAYLRDRCIDCIKIVPSLWLSYSDGREMPLPRKMIIFGGEAFSLNILDHLTRSSFKGAVYNHYGPTETTIGKCIHRIDLSEKYVTMPIGVPFSNTRVYIVDGNQGLCPVGVTGELLIGGDGLARGYLNHPILTSEKFIRDPFGKAPGSKLYRTGDRVKWSLDGQIEYMGRIDEQMKIRGYRIEPGEIESVLLEAPGVRQAVVVLQEDHRGNHQLAAYVTAAGPFDREAVLRYARNKLPEYMVPSSLMTLPAMPLTTIGKIDKRRLPPISSVPASVSDYEAPRSELEIALATIWEELLKVERVGINDNFFELGGNSLMLIRVISYIKKRLMLAIPIQVLFELPRIVDLSKYIELELLSNPDEENPASFEFMNI